MKRKILKVILCLLLLLIIAIIIKSAAEQKEIEKFKVSTGEQVEVFTDNTTIEEILKDPRFEDCAHLFALSYSKKDRDNKISDFYTSNPTWSHADISGGLNRAAEVVDSGVDFYRTIYSEDEIAADKSKANTGLFFFPTEAENAKTVIVIPGGAYAGDCITVEGFPVAAELNKKGYNAYVLVYRTGISLGGMAEPAAEDLHAAIRAIENSADADGIDFADYAVMGFSAGGHLASTLGTENTGYESAGLPKPGALILSYPLVDFKNGGIVVWVCRKCGFGLLSGKSKIAEGYVPNHLSENCPKMYVWAGKNDGTLPYESNAVAIANAAESRGIAYKLQIFEDADHGMGIARDSEAENWLEDAVAFWRN